MEDINALVDAVRQNPEMMEAVSQIAQELEQEGVSPEMLDAIGQAIGQVLDSPQDYPAMREQAIAQGLVDDDDLPTEFDEQYLVAVLLAINEVKQHLSQSPRFARGGLARAGRGGDTMLAHINGAEAEALRRMGGSGTVNPNTGIHEFKGGFFKKVFKVVKRLAPMALAAFGAPYLSPLLGPVGSGALIGGLSSAISGGNILKGALMGGLGGGLGSAFGGESVGSGISTGTGGGIAMPDSFGSWGETAAQIGKAATPAATGSALSGGMQALGEVGGGLAAPGLSTAMEGLGGLGTGVSGALPSLEEAGQNFLPTIPDELKQAAQTANTGLKLAKTGMGVYNALNPPEPEQYSQQNTQRQMQQMGGLGMNTNRAFGYGGNQSRGAGQATRWGYRNGGLARCTCKGN